ncbi:MAG TPA: MerR family transcriptional regulator [Polyangiaceae bacterium LLY-WYZ-14_1]|nr:MerR family transcriptional regulator [Polyangiaceae bacterium LLY-WYZ-14_1]
MSLSPDMEDRLGRLEAEFGGGIPLVRGLEELAHMGVRLSEATFRKYVQLGLLPRSVRVGRKGKHKGSQGLYPPTIVRQILHLRRLMEQGFTIDEIQRELLFVRGDLEALRRQLDRIYAAFDRALREREADREVWRDLVAARTEGDQLLQRLETLEGRMSMRARMERAAV